MTNEEHIKNLETIGHDGWTVTEEAYKSLQYAITVLKQEPILDEIRAEIERERSFQRAMDEYDIATGLRKALEIIDKYMEKSEQGPKQIAYNVGGHTYGVIGGDEIMKKIEG